MFDDRFYRPGTCRNWHQSGARKWKSGAVFIDGCFAMAGDFRKACFLHEYDVCAYCDITSSFFTCICVRWCSDARSYCNDQRASCCCTWDLFALHSLLSRCKSFSLRGAFCLCIKSDFDWRNIICSSCTEPFVQLISLWRSVGKSCILVSLSASY